VQRQDGIAVHPHRGEFPAGHDAFKNYRGYWARRGVRLCVLFASDRAIGDVSLCFFVCDRLRRFPFPPRRSRETTAPCIILLNYAKLEERRRLAV
jgi:hypothetical protein